MNSAGPGLEHAGGRYRLLAASWGSHKAGDVVDLDDEQAHVLVQPGVFEAAEGTELQDAPLANGEFTDVVGVPNYPLVASSDSGPMAITESPLLNHPAVVGAKAPVRRRRRR